MRTYDDSDILLRNSLRVPTYSQMFGGRRESKKEPTLHNYGVKTP